MCSRGAKSAALGAMSRAVLAMRALQLSACDSYFIPLKREKTGGNTSGTQLMRPAFCQEAKRARNQAAQRLLAVAGCQPAPPSLAVSSLQDGLRTYGPDPCEEGPQERHSVCARQSSCELRCGYIQRDAASLSRLPGGSRRVRTRSQSLQESACQLVWRSQPQGAHTSAHCQRCRP